MSASDIIEAGGNLARVLEVTTQCTCKFDEPYPDSKKREERKGLQVECQRCVALAAWKQAISPTNREE